MKKCVSLLLVTLLVSTSVISTAHAEITSISSAINEAGRQRMLTQRMLKFYAMAGIGIDVREESSLQQLNIEIKFFNKQFDELKKFSPNKQVADSLEIVAQLWLPYQKKLTEPVSRANAKWLLLKNEKLLLASHNVVEVLHNSSGTSYTQLVNISGRQRMLSQMLAKIYMFKEWGLYSKESTELAEQVKNEFKTALLKLISAKQNNEGIRLALDDVKSEWELFEYGLQRDSKNPVPLIVAMMSEKILRKMNKITSMYENLK